MHLKEYSNVRRMPQVQVSKRYEIKYPRKVYVAMIEDVELTLKILEHFAQDSVGFPANVTYEDLCGLFPDESHEKISYHLLCAAENDLLKVAYQETNNAWGYTCKFTSGIAGLTAKGGEYVHHARSHFWDKALKSLREQKVEVTTAVLVKYIPAIIGQALGIDG